MRACIGLGSNLAGPRSQIERALAALDTIPLTQVVRHSRLYGSTPVGPSQPDYVNAVALLETGLDALPLLEELQAIEAAQGRVRGAERWGPRTLDLDLLLLDATVMHSERLILPHPRLRERAFVLVPLLEVAPELLLPDGTRVAALADAVNRDELWLLE